MDFVFDACLASGAGVEVIKAVAHMAKSESNTPVEQGGRDYIQHIAETGLHFETPGDINSPIVLPDNPIAKADTLLQQEKTTRTKTGKAIERIPGFEGRAHFGSQYTSDTTHTLVQRYATTNHQDQDDFNHIDYENDPGCNLAAIVTTPNWFNSDNNAQTGSSNVVPTNLKDVIHMADQNIITLDNPDKNSDAPKVDEQREAFAKAAESSVVNTAALAQLHQIVGYCNSLLRGTKNTVLICSAEVYEESCDCAPPNSNSFVNFVGSLCHMQNLTQATRNLATRADGELELYTKRLADFFRAPLGLHADFQSDYLMKRSGRYKLTDEQKRFIDEEAFKARSKGGSTCRDKEKGIFDPGKLPPGYNNWGEVARDEEKGIFAEGSQRKGGVETLRKRMIKDSGEGKGVFLMQCTYRPFTKEKKADWSGGCGGETWTVGGTSGETLQGKCNKCIKSSKHKKWAKRSESLNLKQINIACDSLIANESLQDVLAKLEVLLKPKSVKKRSHSAASVSLKSSADAKSEIKPKSVKKRSHSAPIIQNCACEGGCKNNNCPCRRMGKPCGEHCSCKGCENCPRKSGTIKGYFQSKSK